jgi:hypothetical protein
MQNEQLFRLIGISSQKLLPVTASNELILNRLQRKPYQLI